MANVGFDRTEGGASLCRRCARVGGKLMKVLSVDGLSISYCILSMFLVILSLIFSF